MYGYGEEAMRAAPARQPRQNSRYVTQYVDDEGNFLLMTNARFAVYILETGESTLNVTVTFSCSENNDGAREYVVSIPVTQ
jgi:hypothetical protein